MRAAVALALALALVLALPAGAAHCTTWNTEDAEVDVLGRYYHDADLVCLNTEAICSFWTYEESNGIPGLQRGDEVADSTCHGMIAPDTVIF